MNSKEIFNSIQSEAPNLIYWIGLKTWFGLARKQSLDEREIKAY